MTPAEAKAATRKETVDLLLHPDHGALVLVDHRVTGAPRLRYPWVELAGRGAPTAGLLFSAGLLSSTAPFVGVDADARVLRECRMSYSGEEVRWIHGDLGTLVQSRHEAVRDAGVLVYDSWDAAASDSFEAMLPVLADFARARAAAIGEFLLVINVCLRGVSGGAENQRYRAALDSAFGAGSFTSGSFHVYPSASGHTRMCLTRVRFGF